MPLSSIRASPPRLAAMALLVAAALLPPATPAAAQTVRGHVLDPDSGLPLDDVLIQLLEWNGEVARSALSGDRGAFTLTAPRPGRFRLRAERIGYAATATDAIWLSAGDTSIVRLELATEAVAVEPMTVLVTRRRIEPILDSRKFYEREELYGVKMGAGIFFPPEAIEESPSWQVTDLLREVGAVRVKSLGGRRTDVFTRSGLNQIPLPIYIDGVKVQRHGETINDLIPWSSIGPIEVYPHISPARFGGFAAIVIWTRTW